MTFSLSQTASAAWKLAIPLTTVLGLSSCVTSCYNSNQHDRRVWAGFRNEVLKDQSDRLIAVTIDGVTREGQLNRGSAMPTDSEGKPTVSSLIVAASPLSACWYSTLRVTGGSDKVPLWEKIWGSDLSETYYKNPAFSGEDCLPVPSNN